jgi:hypothetical protein
VEIYLFLDLEQHNKLPQPRQQPQAAIAEQLQEQRLVLQQQRKDVLNHK